MREDLKSILQLFMKDGDVLPSLPTLESLSQIKTWKS